MINRRTGIIAAAVAAALVLSACGGGGNTPAASQTLSTDATAEISYAYWGESQRGFIEQNIAEFNKTYPNIKVTPALTPYRQYWTKLKTQADGKNLPDVFWMNGPNVRLYAGNDQLADLGDLPGIDWANYPEALVDLYSLDGKHYGIPKDFDTVALWYNEKLFADAGVAVPTDNWTWDDFNKAAREISTKLKDQGVYGVTADLSGGQESFYNTIPQAGGYVVKGGKSGYADPASLKGLQFWTDLIKDGAMPSVQVMADNPPNKMFTAGKAAMIWSGTWNTPDYAQNYPNPDELDLVELPKGYNEATTIHGLGNVVAKSSKNMAAAKAFVAFLGSKKAAEIEAAAGATLPAFNGVQDKFLSTYPNWNLKAYTESAKNSAVAYPVSKNTSAWASLESEVLLPGFAGTVPMADAATQMAQKMDELLAKEPK